MFEITRNSRPGRRVGLALVCALAAYTGLTAPSVATAQPVPSDGPLPSCLDQTIQDELSERMRPRGVQQRDFLKKGQVELVARGGWFGADLLSGSYAVGGALAFFFTEDLGLELSFDVTPMALDLDTPLAEFFGDQRFEPATGYLALASLLWSPVHAKLKIGDGIVHSDILFAFGAGRLFHDSVQGVTFDAGVMLEMYLNSWVTLRFDIRDVIAVQEAVAETRLTNNIVTTAGIALWLPTGL